MIGFYLSNVSSPQLILENICRTYHNDTICQALFAGFTHGDRHYNKIQEKAAIWIGGCKFIGNIVKLFALPTVATLSDVFGRHRAMFLIPMGLVVRSSIMLYIVNIGMPFSTWWLLLVGPTTGLVGGVGGLFVFTIAYVSDITPNEERTLIITLIDASAAFAAFTAMLISGFIIEKFGYFWIHVAIICLTTLALLDWLFLITPDKVKLQGISTKSVVFNIVSMDALIKPSLVSCAAYSDNKIRELRKSRRSLKLTKQTSAGSKSLRKSVDETADSVEQVQEIDKTCVGDQSNLEVLSYVSEFKNEPHNEVVHTHIGNASGTGSSHMTTTRGIFSHSNVNIASTSSEGFLNRKMISSHGNKMDRRLAWRKIRQAANPFRNFARIFKAVRGSANAKLEMVLLFVMALTQISNIGELNLIIIFLRNHPFTSARKMSAFYWHFKVELSL